MPTVESLIHQVISQIRIYVNFSEQLDNKEQKITIDERIVLTKK